MIYRCRRRRPRLSIRKITETTTSLLENLLAYVDGASLNFPTKIDDESEWTHLEHSAGNQTAPVSTLITYVSKIVSFFSRQRNRNENICRNEDDEKERQPHTLCSPPFQPHAFILSFVGWMALTFCLVPAEVELNFCLLYCSNLFSDEIIISWVLRPLPGFLFFFRATNKRVLKISTFSAKPMSWSHLVG